MVLCQPTCTGDIVLLPLDATINEEELFVGQHRGCLQCVQKVPKVVVTAQCDVAPTGDTLITGATMGILE